MTFRRKSYQEIVDELLGDLTSGIVDEAHQFESGKDTYDLNSTPVRNISSIRGAFDGLPYTFASGDYELVNIKSVRWVNGTKPKPDVDTLFYVNYNSQEFTSPISDRNIGSVTRTIVEAISREIATLYAQLDKAYLSAFIDTAEGKSLEFVVSILNVHRIRAGSAEGKVTFSRSISGQGNITIPLGTVVSTGARDEGERKFETTEVRTLPEDGMDVDVPIRAVEPGASYVVEAEAITVMPKPIVGIGRVINHEATAVSTTDESDERLRQRAKAALYGAGKATMDAIRYAALEEGAKSVIIREMPYQVPGEVEIVLECAEKDEAAIADAINNTRAAGIKLYTGPPQGVQIKLILELTVPTELPQKEKDSLKGGIRNKINDYVTYLNPGDRVLASKVISLAMSDERVRNVQLSDVVVKIDSFDKTTARVMASQDILVQPREKAVLEDITINTTAEPIGVPPEEKGEALYPINVEVEIWVTLEKGTTKAQAESIIEAKARVYLSALSVEDPIKWTAFKEAIASEGRYTVDKAVLRNFHSLDGLVVTLDRDDSKDTVRDIEGKKESVVVEAVKVQFP